MQQCRITTCGTLLSEESRLRVKDDDDDDDDDDNEILTKREVCIENYQTKILTVRTEHSEFNKLFNI